MLQRSLKSIPSVLVLLILTTFLTSCSGVKELSIFKEEVPRAELNIEKPTPLELEELQWIIITSENAEEVFKKLAKNFARIRNQLKITNDLLDQYKEYYEPKVSEE